MLYSTVIEPVFEGIKKPAFCNSPGLQKNKKFYPPNLISVCKSIRETSI